MGPACAGPKPLDPINPIDERDPRFSAAGGKRARFDLQQATLVGKRRVNPLSSPIGAVPTTDNASATALLFVRTNPRTRREAAQALLCHTHGNLHDAGILLHPALHSMGGKPPLLFGGLL